MTVSSSVNKFRYEGNGVTTVFAFTGRLFSAGDLTVELITRATNVLVETLVITTHYTVTINGDESAAVTITDVSKIPSASQDIQIRRVLAKTQTVDLPTGTRFPAVSVENALDKVTALVQDVSEILDRTVTLSQFSFTTNVVLPEPSASSIIGWNAGGTNLANYSFGTLGTDIDTGFTGLASGDFMTYNGTLWTNTARNALVIDNFLASSSAGGTIKSSGGNTCLSWGASGSANLTLGGNISGGGTLKAVNMADPSSAQDYATKNYVDSNGGDWVAIKTVTASGAATVDFVNGSGGVVLDGTYKAYKFIITDVVPDADIRSFAMRTSTNAGSSYDSGASDYAYALAGYKSNASGADAGSDGAAQILLHDNSVGSATTDSFCGEIILFNPAGTSAHKRIIGTTSINRQAGPVRLVNIVSGWRLAATDVDAVRFLFTANNIASGTFTLYGLKDA